MLAEFKDYIKTLNIGDYVSIGKIDNSKDKSIGIYGDGYQRRIEAVGRASSYRTAGVRILIHWNKNLKQTEEASRTLFNSIRYIRNVQMGDKLVHFIDLNYEEPVFLGTDSNNVYEYVIFGTLYYKE